MLTDHRSFLSQHVCLKSRSVDNQVCSFSIISKFWAEEYGFLFPLTTLTSGYVRYDCRIGHKIKGTDEVAWPLEEVENRVLHHMYWLQTHQNIALIVVHTHPIVWSAVWTRHYVANTMQLPWYFRPRPACNIPVADPELSTRCRKSFACEPQPRLITLQLALH